MEESDALSRMRLMKILFFCFVILVPIGLISLILDSRSTVGILVAATGFISGIVCAFVLCPCCGKPSGFFFKYVVAGVVPVGFCIHCGESYLKSKGCQNHS